MKPNGKQAEKVWFITLKKSSSGELFKIQAKHVALCTGSSSQVPNMPKIPNRVGVYPFIDQIKCLYQYWVDRNNTKVKYYIL